MNKPKSLTNHQFKDKVFKIFIHGFLHLLDYNHTKLKDYKKMAKEEEKIYNSIKKKIKKEIPINIKNKQKSISPLVLRNIKIAGIMKKVTQIILRE